MKRKRVCGGMLVGASMAAVFVLSGCGTQGETGVPGKAESGDPAVARLHGSFSVDVNDPAATVGDADYVFVARVDSQDGTVHKNLVTIETEDGAEEASDPYTNFHVTVIENIKGELKTGESIPLQKAGGMTEDGATLVLYEDDALPAVGGAYVFLAYAQEDGSLLVAGPNSSLAVERSLSIGRIGDGSDLAPIVRKLDESQTVQRYEKAAEEQIVTDRDRSVSDYGGTR